MYHIEVSIQLNISTVRLGFNRYSLDKNMNTGIKSYFSLPGNDNSSIIVIKYTIWKRDFLK